MPLLLNVPYCEKDQAKSLGAKWSTELKRWYVTDRKDYSKFVRWLDGNTVVCDQIYLVEGMKTCYACKKMTRVICFGIEKCFDISLQEDELSSKTIHLASIGAGIPSALAEELKKRYDYKRGFSKTVGYSYNANHCCHCKRMQGNYFLFDEVDSPFFVDGKATAEKLTLHRIVLPYDICVSADVGYGTEDHLIKKYAKLLDSDLQWK